MRTNKERNCCPNCGDDSFSPSRTQGLETLIKGLSPFSPFRCSMCNTRFWASTGWVSYLGNIFYVLVFVALLALLFSQKLFDDSSRAELQQRNVAKVKDNMEIGSAISEAIKLEQELRSDLNSQLEKQSPPLSPESDKRFDKGLDKVVKKAEKTTENETSQPFKPKSQSRQTDSTTQALANHDSVVKSVVKSVAFKTPVVEPIKEPTTLSKPINRPVDQESAKNEQQLRGEVLDQIENWRAAWENQDVARYLASYSIMFKPEKNITYAAWQKKRRTTLLKPTWVKLNASDFKMNFSENNKQVSVTFLQDYAASNYVDKSTKKLTLVLQGGNWNIVREQSL